MSDKTSNIRQLIDKFSRLFYETKELEENIIHSILVTYSTKASGFNQSDYENKLINVNLVRVNIFIYYKDIITNIVNNIKNKRHIYEDFEQNQLHIIYGILSKKTVLDFVTNVKRLNEISYIIFIYKKLIDIDKFVNNNMSINKSTIKARIKTLNNEFEELFDKGEGEEGIVYEQDNIGDYIDYVLDDAPNLLVTGISKIDHSLSGGIMPDDIFVVAARPGLCKTMFCIDIIARNSSVLRKNNKKCLYFSPDTNVKQMYRRLLKRLRCSTNNKDKEYIIKELRDFPIIIADTYWLDEILEIISLNMNDLGIIVVDYIQTIRIRNDSNNRNEQIGIIISKLKAISRKHSIPLILVAQINRSYSITGGQQNAISFIKDSGYIEQEADVVIMIDKVSHYKNQEPISELRNNRQSYYSDNRQNNQFNRSNDDIYNISIVKNRRGSLANAFMSLDNEILSFIESN